MQRVLRQVDKICERLSDPDGRIYDSLFENLGSVLDIAAGLNLADDPRLTALIMQCRQKLQRMPDDIRNSTLTRRATAMAARNISASFGQMGARRLAA